MSNIPLPFDPLIFSKSTDRSATQRTRKIGFLIYPDFEIVDLSGPLDAFYYADRVLQMTGREAEPGYELLVIAAVRGRSAANAAWRSSPPIPSPTYAEESIR